MWTPQRPETSDTFPLCDICTHYPPHNGRMPVTRLIKTLTHLTTLYGRPLGPSIAFLRSAGLLDQRWWEATQQLVWASFKSQPDWWGCFVRFMRVWWAPLVVDVLPGSRIGSLYLGSQIIWSLSSIHLMGGSSILGSVRTVKQSFKSCKWSCQFI